MKTRDEAIEWSEFNPSIDNGAMQERQKVEYEMTMNLLRSVGFCRAMEMSQIGWAEQLKDMLGISGGEFVVGPCAGMTVTCKHEIVDKNGNCEVCAGAGWITQGVQKMLDERKNITELAQDVVDSEGAFSAVLDILHVIDENNINY